jgi:thioredoxin reductase/NAD-dependent dihydropyrimidine dehydrogenase PreA subunit
MGHQVTVFEENDAPGGMLRMGIPEYRLPRTALDREIDYLKELGVALKLNSRVASIGKLLDKGVDAVYLACGAQGGARLGISGDDSPGVMDGISFLKSVNRGQHIKIGTRVAVIGGGNTAVDAARSAIRLGAREVIVKYRRSQAEMTAYEEEVGNALYEGVQFDCLTAPVQIAAGNGHLTVTFNRMKLGAKDAGGRPAPVPIIGSEHTEVFNTVISAIGQHTDIPKLMKLPAGERGFVGVNPETLETDRPGVFAGGDLATGPSSIIDAIAQGRKAAASIDRFLGGRGRIDQELLPPEEEVLVMDYTCDGRTRVTVPCTPLIERVTGFTAVEKELSECAALKEAERCRGCDAREFKVTVHGAGCKDCSYCIAVCKLGVFESSERFNEKGYRPVQAAHPERCVGCLQCFYACPDFAIEVKAAG